MPLPVRLAILSAALVARVTVAAAAPASDPLADAFARLCAETAPAHPACAETHARAAALDYRWSLLAEACDHISPAPSYCPAFAAIRQRTDRKSTRLNSSH